jgi:ribosomal protein S18 acetylase RimI-like enzyme
MRRIGLKYVKMLEYERPLDTPIPMVETKVPVEIKPLSAKDVNNSAFQGIRLTPGENALSHDKTLSRIASGNDMCFVAMVKNELAGYVWFLLKGTNYEPDLEMEETFAEGESLAYQGFVFPKFRGLGIGPKIVEQGLRSLESKGYMRIDLFTEGNNIPAMKTAEKLGFYPVKVITCLRVFMFNRTTEQTINTEHDPRRREDANAR